MASKMYNRARMTVTSTGTGALSLGVAVAGYQTFSSSGAQNGDTVSYTIEDGVNWEIGTGTFNSVAGTLSRTVTQSFNGTTYGTSAISVTTNAQVYITALAADIVVNGGPLGTPSSGTLTNATGLPIATGVSGLGTDVATALAVNTGSAGAIVVNGGALGTPSSGTLTNCTFPTLNQNTTGTAAGLSATLVASSGGTGQSSYTIGDILYASGSSALSKLAGVATGNALISGGTGTAPLWGKVGLTTHVSGTLPVANGGTGITSFGTGVATALGNAVNGASGICVQDASGNLGLGVTPSAWVSFKAFQMPVNSFIAFGGASSGFGAINYNAYNSSTGYKRIGADFASQYYQASGQHVWQTAGSSTADSAISFTQAMTLTSGGNLGIGTSSPGQKLHVNNSSGDTVCLVSAGSGFAGYFGINGGGRSGLTGALKFISYSNGTAEINNDTNGPLIFSTNAAEKARIDSSGNLLVGTTSQISGARVSILNVNGGQGGMGIGNTGGSSATTCISFRNSNGEVGFIQTSASATTFSTSSDVALKENIVDADSSLASILALPIRQFDWKADGSHTDYGVVAQEANECAPEIVSKGEHWSVDYGRITPRLIKAFQELAAKVTALEAANG